MAFTLRECFAENWVPKCMAVKIAPGLYFSKMFIKYVDARLVDAVFFLSVLYFYFIDAIFFYTKSLNTFENVAGL